MKKAFVYYGSDGIPVPNRPLFLRDKELMLPAVAMNHIGNGVYTANIGDADWEIVDTTDGNPGVTTGYEIRAKRISSTDGFEPEIEAAAPSKFWDGSKTFRIIDITDVEGLQYALTAESNERASAIAEEVSKRTSADNTLSSAIQSLAFQVSSLAAVNYVAIPLAAKVKAIVSGAATFLPITGYAGSCEANTHKVNVVGHISLTDKSLLSGAVQFRLESAQLPAGLQTSSFENGVGCWIAGHLADGLVEGPLSVQLMQLTGGSILLTFRVFTGTTQRDLTWDDLGVFPRLMFSFSALRGS